MMQQVKDVEHVLDLSIFQDTFWRRNLFELNLEDDHSFDGLFDQIGKDENSQRAEWVNGKSSILMGFNRLVGFKPSKIRWKRGVDSQKTLESVDAALKLQK